MTEGNDCQYRRALEWQIRRWWVGGGGDEPIFVLHDFLGYTYDAYHTAATIHADRLWIGLTKKCIL